MGIISGKKKIVTIILISVLGCTSKQLSQKPEYDDLYYTSKDKQNDVKQKTKQLPKVEEKKQSTATTGKSDTYIYNFDSKTLPNPMAYKTRVASDNVKDTSVAGQDQINNSNQNLVPNSNSDYNSDVINDNSSSSPDSNKKVNSPSSSGNNPW